MDYYLLANKIKRDTAFACTIGKTPIAIDLIPEIIDLDELPFELILKDYIQEKTSFRLSSPATVSQHLWQDYQPNDLAWPLMSEKMKNVVVRGLTGNEGIIWIKAPITHDQLKVTYYIPRFTNELDVLDMQKTIFVKETNHIVKPCFSASKVANFGLFHKPQFWKITSSLYVNEKLKKTMLKEKLTGVGFEKTCVI